MIKKIVIVALIFLLLAPPAAISPRHTNLLHSSSAIHSNINGKTLYVGGNGPNNYTKIQDAVNDAEDGDIIFVYSGIYYENVVVDRSITLIGENRNTTIIESRNWTEPIKISADNVRMIEFMIRSDEKSSAIIYSSYSNNVMMNSLIIQSGKMGIHLFYCENTTISNTFISECGCGIFISFSNYTVLNNNTIERNGDGIELSHSRNAQIIGNRIFKNNCAIFLDNSHNCIIIQNAINYTHVQGIYLFSSENNLIIKNNILEGRWGILIDNALDLSGFNVIMHNNVSNHLMYGIDIEWSFGNKIIENNISCSDIALNLVSSFGAIIVNNNFVGNRKDAYFEKFIAFGCVPLNLILCNYWERAHFLPKPLLGKLMPGNIPWFCFDFYPRIYPYEWWKKNILI